MLSWGFFDASRLNAQSHIIQFITNPTQKDHEVTKNVSFVSLDNLNYKQILIALSHKHDVSFLTFQYGSNSLEELSYYFNLQNIEYIHNIDTLNKNLTLDQFNNLTSPITNLNTSEIYFSMPTHQYVYKIYPYSSIDEASIYGNYYLYGNIEDVENFISDLETNNIMVHNLPEVDVSIDTIMLKEAFIGHPLRVFSLVSIFVAIYLLIFFDKRNLSIMMVYGLSKVRYTKTIVTTIVKFTLLTFIFSLITFLILSRNFHVSHMTSIARFYLFLVLLTVALFAIGSMLIIMTFTEVTTSSYVNPTTNTSGSLIFINLLKICLIILLGFNLLPLLVNVYQTTILINSAKNQREHFNNIYYLDMDNDYSLTVIKNHQSL